MMQTTKSKPTILTIAGSDTSAGAGLQADLKTIHALDGYALTVPTAITAQNSQGVHAVYPLPAEQVAEQLHILFDDYEINAVKIGMLGNLAILETVTQILKQRLDDNTTLIVDPIFISSSGKTLLEEGARDYFLSELLPLADVITPNLHEVNYLLSREYSGQENEINEIAEQFQKLNTKSLVVKGGHSQQRDAVDYLISFHEDEIAIEPVSTPRIDCEYSHGTGCTYASAIATELAKGTPMSQAMTFAKDYLFHALLHAEKAQPKWRTDITGRNTRDHKGGLHHFWQCDD